jgi:hypothetical protein
MIIEILGFFIGFYIGTRIADAILNKLDGE